MGRRKCKVLLHFLILRRLQAGLGHGEGSSGVGSKDAALQEDGHFPRKGEQFWWPPWVGGGAPCKTQQQESGCQQIKFLVIERLKQNESKVIISSMMTCFSETCRKSVGDFSISFGRRFIAISSPFTLNET